MNNPSVIVYRSRAVVPASDVDLFYLLAQARERNEIDGISGMLVYDRGHFFQWIEGEPRLLGMVWASIRVDGRHTDIEVLADREMPFSLFAEWSMQFAHRDKAFVRLMDGFVEADPRLLDALHTTPSDVPGILAGFSRFGRDPTWPDDCDR